MARPSSSCRALVRRFSAAAPLPASPNPSAFAHVHKVGVIGAGVAGLQAARSLRARGLDVTLFEAAPKVGGVWRSNYAAFGLQAPAQLYSFPDGTPPGAAGSFPSGEAVQANIEAFALAHHSAPRTGARIERLERRPDGARGWRFHVADAAGRPQALDFDYAVVATGMYSDPAMPALPGRAAFKGAVLHSRDFDATALKAATGKHVVVLGGAKSAIDCAVVAAEAAQSSTLLFRHAHWATPRNIAGLIPFQYVFLSRLGQALVSWYKGAWPTAPASVHLAHSVLAPVMAPVFKIVEALFAFQLGLYGERKPSWDVVKDFYGYAQVLDTSFDCLVKGGRIAARKGEVVRLEADAVVARMADGAEKRLPCDVLVCGTGFQKRYDYLPVAERAALDVQDDGLYLYRHMLPAHVPDLAFVGSEVATISNIATHAVQSEWLARALVGDHVLPAPAAMASSVEKHKAWARAWMPPSPSRASLVLLHQIHYHDSLLKDIRVPHRRWGGVAEILWPYEAGAFDGIVGQPLRKHKS